MSTLRERGLPEAVVRRPLPPFTSHHEQLRQEIRRFVATELRPHAREWEDARWFPDNVFTRMAGQDLLGLKYPRELGGRGGDHLDDAVLTEELARCGSGGLAAGIGAHVGIATPPIASFGTDEQKQRFSPRPSAARGSRRWESPSPEPALTWPAYAPSRAGSTAATWSTDRRPS